PRQGFTAPVVAGLRVRKTTMRKTVGLAIVLGTMIGCGGGEEPAHKPAAPAAPPTTLQQGTAAPKPPAGAEAYELDVIVEGEPDEGPPPLTLQRQGSAE